MTDLPSLYSALEDVAGRWRDPAYPPREDAVSRTLQCENRFTAEAIAFAINQQMQSVTADRLEEWVVTRVSTDAVDVGVLAAGNIPLGDLQDFIAVIATGHRYLGVTSSKSPFLLPAFASDLAQAVHHLPAEFVDYQEMLDRAEAVIATGSNETIATVARDLDEASVSQAHRLLRGNRFSVAVIDGNETEDEREALAEDTLLHEGLGCRNVGIIWAPWSQSPDPYLEAFAHFRGVFPAHERTPGSLKMHQAMLAAVNIPHAFGDGLEFLLSKGEPEIQVPGHVRWAEYDDLDTVSEWITRHRDELQVVVARPHLAKRLTAAAVEVIAPGEAQRPELDWCPDRRDTIAFLSSLRSRSSA